MGNADTELWLFSRPAIREGVDRNVPITQDIFQTKIFSPRVHVFIPKSSTFIICLIFDLEDKMKDELLTDVNKFSDS